MSIFINKMTVQGLGWVFAEVKVVGKGVDEDFQS